MIPIVIFIKLHEYNMDDRKYSLDNDKEVKQLFILSLIMKNGINRNKNNRNAINTTIKSLEIVENTKMTNEKVIIENNSTKIKLKLVITVKKV